MAFKVEDAYDYSGIIFSISNKGIADNPKFIICGFNNGVRSNIFLADKFLREEDLLICCGCDITQKVIYEKGNNKIFFNLEPWESVDVDDTLFNFAESQIGNHLGYYYISLKEFKDKTNSGDIIRLGCCRSI